MVEGIVDLNHVKAKYQIALRGDVKYTSSYHVKEMSEH